MDNKNIPYIAFEAEMARHEREKLRLVKALIVAILVILISNAGWLWFFNQFDFQTETVMFDTTDGGDNSYIGNDGVINNGKDDGKEHANDAQATP